MDGHAATAEPFAPSGAAETPPPLRGRAARAERRGEGPLRVMLLTDTLADVNGVSRFIRDMGTQALEHGRELTIVTSTRLPLPPQPNFINIVPRLATSMPAYKNLEVVTPPFRRVRQLIRKYKPDLLHVSTPGPVGVAAWWAARRMRIPMVGVYHTDFPAYIDHLMDDKALAYATAAFMRWFYRPFRLVFTRSEDYANIMVAMGMPRGRLKRLFPGTDTHAFHPRFADRTVWRRHGLDEQSVKAIFVGRVSVEKNMPLLVKVWRSVQLRLLERGLKADLVVVGDGPYRATMEQQLGTGQNGVHFLGFRHGAELSTLYASSDLFVFPSVTDTLGQVVLEAQASAIPVLVTDEGGPKEVIRDGVTGLVLDADAPDAWVDAIIGLVADRARLRQMGLDAHDYAQQMSIGRSFEEFWAEHEAVLAGRIA